MIDSALDLSGLRKWGAVLGELAGRERVFVALFGPLGAGKTTLIQAACAGAGVTDPVTSPTYTLVHWYQGALGQVAHADLYRIDDPRDLAPLGWEDLESGEFPVFVEWAERAGTELPPTRWELRLSLDADPELRHVRGVALGGAPAVPDPELAAETAGREAAC